MRLVSLFIVLILPFAQVVRAESDPVILVLGDSLSAAYEMEQKESWPSLLQNQLLKDGYAYRVFNSSIVGDTTQAALTRLPRVLAEQKPAFVIIELGGNDGLRGLPLGVSKNNLRSMIDQSQAIGARVVLAGMLLPPNYGKTYIERFSAMYTDLATELKVTLIPFFLQGIALQPELMMDDGIHPTAEAQPILVDTVWQALQSAF